MTVSSPLVIGIGHPDRGDDAVGTVVARAVQESAAQARVVLHSGEAAGLVALWEDEPWCILIDAMVSGRPCGAILRWEPTEEPLPGDLHAASTHGLSVAGAVELARALEALPERLIIFGIEAGDVTLGAPLSPQVAAAAERVTGRILTELGCVEPCTSTP